MPEPDDGAALHADALELLRGWRPPAVDQGRLRDRYVEHLLARPDGMTRGCFPDHLTAGTIVVAQDGSAVLLNLHRKVGRWVAFGGHCEPGDATLAAAAYREAVEESGLPELRLDPNPVHLDEHVVDFCDPRGPVHHLDVRFAVRAPAGAAHVASAESLDVRWWPVDALPELEPEMHELITLALTAPARRV